mgnify:CR=1 FL=1
MFKKVELSKKVKMYLGLQGKKIEDFVVEIKTEDGELYYTDNVKNFMGNVLGIREDGKEFGWLEA